jgi:surface antigen
MRMKFLTMVILAVMVTLSGCATSPSGHTFVSANQAVGIGVGGLIGGVAGSFIGGGTGRLVAVGTGAVLGSALGAAIGYKMDRYDEQLHTRASQQSYNAQLGQTIMWQNPESGNTGSVRPTRQGENNSGQYCREFYHIVTVGGQDQQLHSIACQNPDGTWTPHYVRS